MLLANLLTSVFWPDNGDFSLSVSFRRALSIRSKMDFVADDLSYRVLRGDENLVFIHPSFTSTFAVWLISARRGLEAHKTTVS